MTRGGDGLDYARAGVDIDAARRVVEAIKPLARSTARPGADALLGGFGGLFDLKKAGFGDPLLIAGADGVGTKLRLAIECGRHDSVGIDCVAMCANDVVAQGAEPLFFLDYIAVGRLDPAVATDLVRGVAAGCRQAGCALIGGECAELPGLYAERDYDLAGFCVGAVDRERLLPRPGIAPGDMLLGLASSGLHANGFSLVRRVLGLRGLTLDDEAPFAPGESLGRALLRPTRIYAGSCLAALAGGGVKALCHVTGGGLIENLPRVLPRETVARLELGSWKVPPVFGWLAGRGGRHSIGGAEMLRTFNCGLGMIAIVDRSEVAPVADRLRERGEDVAVVGRLTAGDGTPRVDPVGLGTNWLGG